MKQGYALFCLAFTVLFACTACGAANAAAPGKTAAGVTLTVEAEKAVLPAGSAQQPMVRIAISAPAMQRQLRRTPPVDLAIALDCSGSMSGEKIAHARLAARNALELLGEDDVFSLILYNQTAKVLIPSTRATASTKEELRTVIDSIPAGGGTALFAGVSLAADELRKLGQDPRRVQRIILLSDGQANVGPSSPAELGRLGASLVKEGITVSTVGIGNDYNEDLMTALAQNADGNFYFIANSADLGRYLAQELGCALSVAARGVKVRITCPEGVTPRGILGYQCRIEGRTIELDFNQIYAGHDKVLILQLALPPQPAGSVKDLADVTLEYITADAVKAPEVTRRVAVNFTADEDVSKRSLNKEVSASVALQQSAVLREEAVSQADSGNVEFANRKLDEAKKLLEDNAAETKVPAVKAAAEQLNKDADKFVQAQAAPASGELKEARKEMRGRSFQIINSQPVKQ